MGTIDRLETLIDKISEGKVSTVAYFRNDGGNTTLYTQEYVNEKDNVINGLLKRISNLEFELERLNNKLKEIDNSVEKVHNSYLLDEDMFNEFYDKYQELKGVDKK